MRKADAMRSAICRASWVSTQLKMTSHWLTARTAFPRKIGADAWFDRQGADRYEITEQSFRVPDEGVVTILRLHEAMIGL